MPIIPTPEFQQAAYTAFMNGMGAEALASFRELVRWFPPGAATMQCKAWLDLSENDQEIFRAVAFKLRAEIEAELSA